MIIVPIMHLLVSAFRSVVLATSQIRNPIIMCRSLRSTRLCNNHLIRACNKNRACTVLCSTGNGVSTAEEGRWHYEVVEAYPISKINEKMEASLPRLLHNINPDEYPSVSQAKKACRLGAIMIFRKSGPGQREHLPNSFNFNIFTNLNDFELLRAHLLHRSRVLIIAALDTIVEEGDIIAVRVRAKDVFYPTSCTGYIHPPSNIDGIEVIYEDDHIGVVNKPGLMSTIGEKRQDLQSCLPFILSPPATKLWCSNDAPPLPRPVHRLDRRTSGLVLVAKTKKARSLLSENFRMREIEKSYAAIVFGKPDTSTLGTRMEELGEKDVWNMIDYPIDGKPSVTLWRLIRTVETATHGTLSLLLCKPKTGRYHQIRRHLSYCLGAPIVGDNKYDKGFEIAKHSRSFMFLCSNGLSFKHPSLDFDELSSSIECSTISKNSSSNPLETVKSSIKIIDIAHAMNQNRKESHLRVEIPLPLKFKEILG